MLANSSFCAVWRCCSAQACLLLVSVVTGAGRVGHAQTYSNPLDTPAFPPPAGPTADGPADPVVIEFEGRYDMLPTGDSVQYKSIWSDDLMHWSDDRSHVRSIQV